MYRNSFLKCRSNIKEGSKWSSALFRNIELLIDDRTASGVVTSANKGAMNIVATGSVQTCVALIFTEEEFVALAEGCQELRWTRRLLEKLRAVQYSTTVFEDKQG